MKNFITILTILNTIAIGYLFTPKYELGGNSQRTGFNVIDGDKITIGTSTQTHEFEIYNTATGTIRIYGSGACQIFRDTDDSGDTYCTYLNGSQTCSASDICN